MILSLAAALTLSLSGQPGDRWVWALYDNDNAVVLAREVTDTPQLSTVLECEPGSGVARLTVYGPQARPEFVTLSAGDVSADTERVQSDGLAVQLRLDHPLFAAFGRGETLTVSAGEESVSAPAPASAILNRFRTACLGAA